MVSRKNTLQLMTRISRTAFTTALSSALMLGSATMSFADTLDFGGMPERFSGNGDRQPPRCQIDVPRAAQSPFFIKWNCTDDKVEAENIRTSLWILRNGAIAPEKVKDFLGFPASVFVDAGLLGVENFTDGLPAAFRLVASDRAGTSALSKYLTVLAQDNSVDSCDLVVVTDPTESEGSTTGVPSRQVLLSNVRVTTTQVGNNDVSISTSAAVSANPCEIDEICSNREDNVSFRTAITFTDTDGTTTAEGSVSLTPGELSSSSRDDVVVNVSGTAVVADSSLTSLEVTGDTALNGVATRLSLSCSR